VPPTLCYAIRQPLHTSAEVAGGRAGGGAGGGEVCVVKGPMPDFLYKDIPFDSMLLSNPPRGGLISRRGELDRGTWATKFAGAMMSCH